MADDQITITFECLNCGGTVLELPDDYTDDSIAVCKSCLHPHGTYGDIKAKALELAEQEVLRVAQASFDRIKNAFSGRR